jgi:hypothetical protein
MRMSEESTESTLHAVVHYPNLSSGGVREFRRKYDPYSELIAEHLTLVFPVPMSLEVIRAHVQTIAKKSQPFDIHITGLKKTWDHWMYLGLQEGNEEFIALHDQLYSGPLEQYLRTDLVFEPHVGLGFFGKGAYDPLDPESVEFASGAYNQALKEAAELGLDEWRRVERLTVVQLNSGLDKFEDVAVVDVGS